MGETTPSLSDHVDALTAAGRIGDAWRLLNSPQAAADPEAMIRLASWRLAGQFVRRDLAASREHFRQAAELGHDDARTVYASFLAGGTGGARNWSGALDLLREQAASRHGARDELALIERMKLSPEGNPQALPPATPLSEHPRALCCRKLLSPAECRFLISRALPRLAPSVVIDPYTGRHVQNPIRTSDGMAFPYVLETPAIHALNRRLAAVTSTDVAAGEPLQVLRYRPGQEYRPHSDAVAGDANQRTLTVLVYLNRGYGGGETRFVRTGHTFKGEPGDALIFWNALPDGRADELAQHAGLPVTAGEKLIASRWVRARPFAVPPPPPMLEV